MMHHKILLAAVVVALLTSCASLERDYGQRSTEVLLTTRSQVELAQADSQPAPTPDPAQQAAMAKLAANVYAMTWRQWQQMDGATLLRKLRESELQKEPEVRSAAALRLATALVPYLRGEGKTPLKVNLPMALHMVIAERDGRYEAIEFNPQRQSTAVVGL